MTIDPREFVAGIFDRAAATYDAVGVDFFVPIARALLELADVRPGEDVLDIGCGRGAVLFLAADRAGPTGHVTGIDLSPRMIEVTARDIDARGIGNATVRVADAQQLVLEQASYDVITASLSLFFLPHPPEAFGTYRRALKPSGRLVFTTFAGDDPRWAWFQDLRKQYLPDTRPPGVQHFGSQAAIDALLRDAGFSDLEHRLHAFDVRFETPERWWEWTWSQGMRAAWEQMDEVAFAQARVEIDAGMARIREPDGSVLYHQPFRVTRAGTA